MTEATANVISKAVETVREKFNFTIDKFPLQGPDNLQTPCYGLFRSDTNAYVGDANNTKSKDYCVHQTDDVIALVEACESVFEDCVATCHFRDGHYVSLAPSNDMRRAVFGTNDNVFPRLVIRGGFDRKSFSASLGYYRDACRNLAMLQSVNSVHESIRHNNNLRPKMDELIAQFQTLKEGWQTISGLIDGMQANSVNLVSFLNDVYGEPDEDSKRAVTVHKNRTEKIFNRLSNERIRTGRDAKALLENNWEVSAWEAFNAVQGYVQWDANRKKGSTDFDRIILASNDAKVLKAERLALAAISDDEVTTAA